MHAGQAQLPPWPVMIVGDSGTYQGGVIGRPGTLGMSGGLG
jgi:hypothetical protein